MNGYKKSTEELPSEFTPVWVRINGRRPRKMFLCGDTFFYYNEELCAAGLYSSIGKGVIWKYCKTKKSNV